MAKCRPGKWVPWALVGAGLPFLAAAVLNSGSLKSDIANRATAALAGNEATAWATVENDGRDFVVKGTSPSQDAIDSAVKAVAGTYGVRTVTANAQIVEPVKLVAPTVESVNATVATPEIKGTWQEGVQSSLAVSVAGATYKLGESPELTSQGGNWSLKLANPLPEGSYDVTAESSDGKTAMNAEAPGKIVVDLPEPAPAPEPQAAPLTPLAPAVVPTGAIWPYTLTGTWPEAPGSKLMAKVDGRVYEFGRGAALTSDGKGNFSFAPQRKFAPGSYDVEFTATDPAGNTTTSVVTAGIVVPEPPQVAQAEPEPAPEPAPAPAPVELPAPTVEKQLDLTGAPLIKGTWPEGPATALTVGVNGRNYILGQDANLRSKDGNWTLLPGAALKDGTYDVVVTAADAAGNSRRDETLAELEVDGVPPAAPAVTAYSGDASPASISGTWDEKQATGLTVTMPDINYSAILGAAGSPLTSDGAGNWTLAINRPLPPGTYEVQVASRDVHGRVQTETTAGEVVIAAAPEPAAPAAEPQVVIPERPFDCEAVLARLNQVFPIRFGFDLSKLEGISSLSLSQYAALLKDPRCATMKVEIGGHADFKGSERYNQGLSERRANTVLASLQEAGVDVTRLAPKGYSENNPLDPAQTDEAREKNRRVEITVVK